MISLIWVPCSNSVMTLVTCLLPGSPIGISIAGFFVPACLFGYGASPILSLNS